MPQSENTHKLGIAWPTVLWGHDHSYQADEEVQHGGGLAGCKGWIRGQVCVFQMGQGGHVRGFGKVH